MDVEVAFERPDYAYEIRGPELPFFHNTFPSSITGIRDMKWKMSVWKILRSAILEEEIMD
jgi:hypothetical protein